MSKKRNVIVHIHIFKNAGSSLDGALERNFKDTFVDHREDHLIRTNKDYLKEYLQKHENIQAFSSHSIYFKPVSFDNTVLHPTYMLRHPIERIKSVYSFEKKQPAEDSLGAKMAKQFNFEEYVAWRMQDDIPPTIRNLQTVFLAGANHHANYLDEKFESALETLNDSPLIGIVDRYDESMVVFEECLKPFFPDIDLSYIRKNVTDTNTELSVEEKAKKILMQFDREMQQKIKEKNRYDLELYERANALLDQKIEQIEDFDKKLEAFIQRCSKEKSVKTSKNEKKSSMAIQESIKQYVETHQWENIFQLFIENKQCVSNDKQLLECVVLAIHRIVMNDLNGKISLIDNMRSMYELFQNKEVAYELIRLIHAENSIQIEKVKDAYLDFFNAVVKNKDVNIGLFIICVYLRFSQLSSKLLSFLVKNIEASISLDDILHVNEALFDLLSVEDFLEILSKCNTVGGSQLNKYYLLSLICYINNINISDYVSLKEIDEVHLSPLNNGKKYGVISNYVASTKLKNMCLIYHNFAKTPNKAGISKIAIVHKRKPNLKVALCISGQLRGYNKVYQYLKESILDELSPDIFISTWKDIGSKLPVPIFGQASRIFSDNILDAWLKIGSAIGLDGLKERYNEVFDLLDAGTISTQELRELYKTDYIDIEDDKGADFVSFSNSQKMYYKIDKAHQMMEATGREYDLVIRIRPDRIIKKVSNTNWHEVVASANNDNVLIADFAPKLNSAGLVMGDMIAIGSMENVRVYASTWRTNQTFKELSLPGEQGMIAHVPLANRCWMNGIQVVSTLEGIRFRELINQKDRITPKEMFDLLGNKLKNSQNQNDILLYKAVMKDLGI